MMLHDQCFPNYDVSHNEKRIDSRNNMIGQGIRVISALLPASWHVELPTSANEPQLALRGPDGSLTVFSVTSRWSWVPMEPLIATLREQALSGDLPLLFVSDYIGPSMRKALAAEGISYVDGTGWVRVTSELPLILLTGQGASKSPRAGSPSAVTRLNGVAASRIIRTLCVTGTPLGVRELALAANVSPGSVSKLLPTLAAERVIDRDERGGVIAVRRRALIDRWVQDYGFSKSNPSVRYFIAPRGVDRTLDRIGDVSGRVSLTGSAAVRRLLPMEKTAIVPLRLLALYADDPATVAEDLGLIPADAASANTVVAIPQDADVLTSDVASPALVLADLLTLPNRGDAEAQQLMNTFAQIDEEWKA